MLRILKMQAAMFLLAARTVCKGCPANTVVVSDCVGPELFARQRQCVCLCNRHVHDRSTQMSG